MGRSVGHALGGPVGGIAVSMAGAALDDRRRRRTEKAAKMRQREQTGKNVNAVGGTGYEYGGVAIDNAKSYHVSNNEGQNDVNDNYNCKYNESPFGSCGEKTVDCPGSKYGQRYGTKRLSALHQNANNENAFEDEDKRESEDEEAMDRLESTEGLEEDQQEENEEDGSEEERPMPIPVIDKSVEDGLEEEEEYDDGLGVLLSFSHAEGDWFGSILTKCCADEDMATLIGAATCYSN